MFSSIVSTPNPINFIDESSRGFKQTMLSIAESSRQMSGHLAIDGQCKLLSLESIHCKMRVK
jgi:hypothetical protein